MGVELTVFGPAKLSGFVIVSLKFDESSEKTQAALLTKIQNGANGNIDQQYIINDPSGRSIKFLANEHISAENLADLLGTKFSAVVMDSGSYRPNQDQTFTDAISASIANKRPRPKI